jgi:hypothetical protein
MSAPVGRICVKARLHNPYRNISDPTVAGFARCAMRWTKVAAPAKSWLLARQRL